MAVAALLLLQTEPRSLPPSTAIYSRMWRLRWRARCKATCTVSTTCSCRHAAQLLMLQPLMYLVHIWSDGRVAVARGFCAAWKTKLLAHRSQLLHLSAASSALLRPQSQKERSQAVAQVQVRPSLWHVWSGLHSC